MNKKFYEAPELEVIVLETQGFLAASTDPDDGTPLDMGGESGGTEEDDGFGS